MSRCEDKGIKCVWGLTALGKVWRGLVRFNSYEDSMYDSTLILRPFGTWSKIRKDSKRTTGEDDGDSSGGLQTGDKSKASLYFDLLKCYLRSYRPRFTPPRKKKGSSLEMKLRKPTDINALFGRLRKKHPKWIFIDQDERYIEWRIYDNPFVKYKTYFIYRKNKLEAYCYFNITKERNAYIAELTFDDPDAGAYLLGQVLSKLRKERTNYVSFFGNMKNPLMAEVFKLLDRFGFYTRPSVMDFVIKNISLKDDKDVSDITNWYASGLWSEGARF